MTRVAVWGDGAVGTGLAVALSTSGNTVELVGPPGSGRGEITVTASGYIAGQAVLLHSECGDPVRADVNLLTVKAYDLSEVSGPASSAAPVTIYAGNGMGLARSWGPGWDAVERMVLTAGFRLDRSRWTRVVPGSTTVRRDGAASRLLNSTTLEIIEVDDIVPEVWAKWLVNSVVNPFGALSGATNSDLVSLGLESVMAQVLDELAYVVPDRYREYAAESASRMLSFLTLSSDNRCSMLQDIESGGRTEIDFLTGFAEMEEPGSCPLARLLSDLVRARSSPD